MLVQYSSATFIGEFGQVKFDQFYIVFDTYGHVTMALMDSVKVSRKVTTTTSLPVVLFVFC